MILFSKYHLILYNKKIIIFFFVLIKGSKGRVIGLMRLGDGTRSRARTQKRLQRVNIRMRP